MLYTAGTRNAELTHLKVSDIARQSTVLPLYASTEARLR